MQKVDLGNLDEIIENGTRGKQQKNESNLRYKMEKDTKSVTINPSDFVGVLGNTHRVNMGKYQSLIACTKDTGKCPICEKLNDAWAMVNKLADETVSELAEDKRVEAKKKVQKEQIALVHSRAFEKALPYLYYVTAKLRDVDLVGKDFTVNETVDYEFSDGSTAEIPAFDIKIKRVSVKAFRSLQDEFKAFGMNFEGGITQTIYPNTDDSLALGRDKKVRVIDNDIITDKYPRLQEAIDAEVRALFKATKSVGADGNEVYNYDCELFKEIYSELDSERLAEVDVVGIANNVLGIWYDYQEYIKTNADTTFRSFKEGKGIKGETPTVPLDVESNNDMIANATEIGSDDDLPF